MLYVGTGLAILALWLFCLIDVIVTDDYRIRNMPKSVWVLVVVLLPTVGSVAWLVAGRPGISSLRQRPPVSGVSFLSIDRPGRQVAQNLTMTIAFLRQVRPGGEQRQRAAEERRRREEQGLD